MNLVKMVAPNGVTTVYVSPEKAERLRTIQGYREVTESPVEAVSEPVIESPKRTPRPRKKA